MNEKLRERSAQGLAGYGGCISAADARVIVDAIHGDIEAAGFVLVERDRWERVRRVAEWAVTTPAIPSDVARPITLPGDLDGDV